MCIQKEEYIKLRYLLVFNAASAHSISITIDKMELKEHYYNYIGKLKAKNEVELQERIMKKMEMQIQETAGLVASKGKEEIKAKYQKGTTELMEDLDRDIKKGDLARLFVSKTTGLKYTNLWVDFTNLIISENLKATSVTIKGTDCFTWRVIINVEKHEVNKSLKADFLVIKPKKENVSLLLNL
jgi:hypothetical protein